MNTKSKNVMWDEILNSMNQMAFYMPTVRSLINWYTDGSNRHWVLHYCWL